ncbi:MAG: hypothetical protein ACYCSO_00410 [Cuniculiplasma sp.]
MLDIAYAIDKKQVVVISHENVDLKMGDAELVFAKNDKELISAMKKPGDSEEGYLHSGRRPCRVESIKVKPSR